MKKLLIFLALVTTGFIVNSKAQVRVNVGINIGSQPDWGPVGYDHVDYYYMPDMDVYYYVPRRQFIYADGGRWVFAASLPPRYGGYDLYNSYKVVVNEPRPYLRANVYRDRYASYRGGGRRGQEMLRDRHDNGKHKGWYKEKHGHGRGH
ncbi:hypothetical protein [Ferruginibacter sp.]